MEPQLEERLTRIEAKIEAIHRSAEKARRYALIHLIVALFVFAIPILGIAIAIPTMLETFSKTTITLP